MTDSQGAAVSLSVNVLSGASSGNAALNISFNLWPSVCPGTWTNASSRSASFVPSSIPAGACNNCLLPVRSLRLSGADGHH
ncbi:uncharacterized protein STAUR_8365 [Stigmatella aurantiaca DW4/3-1]|uniref:Uncharacterized protein n=1 Tax=Stigmatella aurantiaca (strain DW4/3-1) TaxID=378806 RepID=Q093B9_STIAD|nr:uncharacterized protein STAUR_8365 [Stigmatella aurantiaca DW4/3-1]EAU66840.1 hypothetical protein STIAU_3044 [Stigmatella aurantiaca DW4/3-1]